MCHGWGAGATERLCKSAEGRGRSVEDVMGRQLLQKEYPVVPQRTPLKYM